MWTFYVAYLFIVEKFFLEINSKKENLKFHFLSEITFSKC